MPEIKIAHSKLLDRALEDNRRLRLENEKLRRKAMEHEERLGPDPIEFIVGDLGIVETKYDDAKTPQTVDITLLSYNLVPSAKCDDLTSLSISPAQAFHFGVALMQAAKLHGFEV